MQHAGWDVADQRWIRINYIWLISGELLIRTQPLNEMPSIKRSPKWGRSIFVDELRLGLLADGSLRILMLTDGEYDVTVYSGAYWYGLWTPTVEESDKSS